MAGVRGEGFGRDLPPKSAATRQGGYERPQHRVELAVQPHLVGGTHTTIGKSSGGLCRGDDGASRAVLFCRRGFGPERLGEEHPQVYPHQDTARVCWQGHLPAPAGCRTKGYSKGKQGGALRDGRLAGEAAAGASQAGCGRCCRSRQSRCGGQQARARRPGGRARACGCRIGCCRTAGCADEKEETAKEHWRRRRRGQCAAGGGRGRGAGC
mmetsp:Transcript_35185/g.105189  ORF Transcript_35185/g.105189 Transcript_35185/m.105189 type:complete len:211 (+) Transcript_35185:469-1101(+)